MPRFWDLFLAAAERAERLDWRGFCEVGAGSWGGKMLVGGLTCDFWAENSKKNKSKNSRFALRALLRPFDVAQGRAVAPWARQSKCTVLKPCP